MGEADRQASLPGPYPVQRGSRAVVQGAKGGDWVEGALSLARLCPLPLVRGAPSSTRGREALSHWRMSGPGEHGVPLPFCCVTYQGSRGWLGALAANT